MTCEFLTSKHPVFKSSNILQTGALMKREKGGVEKHFQKRARQYSHARESYLGVQSTLFLFAVKSWS